MKAEDFIEGFSSPVYPVYIAEAACRFVHYFQLVGYYLAEVHLYQHFVGGPAVHYMQVSEEGVFGILGVLFQSVAPRCAFGQFQQLPFGNIHG